MEIMCLSQGSIGPKGLPMAVYQKVKWGWGPPQQKIHTLRSHPVHVIQTMLFEMHVHHYSYILCILMYLYVYLTPRPRPGAPHTTPRRRFRVCDWLNQFSSLTSRCVDLFSTFLIGQWLLAIIMINCLDAPPPSVFHVSDWLKPILISDWLKSILISDWSMALHD